MSFITKPTQAYVSIPGTVDANGDVTLAAAQVPGTPSGPIQSIQGYAYTGTFTVTRAANQTPYTANDVVGGALTIATVGPAAGEILITAIRIMLNITALPAGMTTFTLHLYNVTPPSAIADNGAFTLGSGDRAAYIGSILGIAARLIGTGTSSVVAVLELSPAQQFKIASGSQLFAYLVTDGAFTPAANSETYSGTAKALGI
jgi:hypothetical protein